MTIQVGYLEQLDLPARFDRGLLADIFYSGVVRDGDVKVTSGGGHVSSIAAGSIYIPGTDNIGQGTYRLYNDATRTLTHDNAVSYSRVDQIIAYIQDADEGGASNAGFIAIVKGTESNGTQVADPNGANYRAGAALDSSLPHNWVRITDILVPAGSGAIPSGNFVDKRLSARPDCAPGDIIVSAAPSPPAGFAAADGRLISRVENPICFARLGTTHGAGNGTTTFALPDSRGRAIVGAGLGAGLTNRGVGALFGEETHELTVDELPQHAHMIQRTNRAASAQGVDTSSVYGIGQNTGTDYAATNNTGSSFDHNNIQPSIALSAFVKLG